jgi:predicted ATPase
VLNILSIANYRSIRKLAIRLGRLNIVTGPNGSGKSSLYRALRLLAEASHGNLVASLAREGGLQSTLWAGPEDIGRAMRSGQHPVQGTLRKDSVHLQLGFAADDFSYAIDLGFPVPHPHVAPERPSLFSRDPEIKRECIWAGAIFRPGALLVDRRGPSLRVTDDKGNWQVVPGQISGFESMMSEFADPRSVPEMIAVREKIRSWRFYDHFRSDAGAPARLPQIGTHSPVLSNDGSDLAAALQTIREIGDALGLDHAIDDAFPGARLEIAEQDGWFELAMRQHGLLRALKSSELSDGTLRYLLLVAALLTPRPPELLVLNEPETSLHPDLVPALARLIIRAAANSQIIVVSHNAILIERLGCEDGAQMIRLTKTFGETQIEGRADLDAPLWHWPKR